MKYLKFFEELDFRRGNISFRRKRSSDDGFVEYLTTVDNIKYYIIFEREFDNFWTREYDAIHSGLGYLQTNKSPLKIVSAVTDITEDFIQKNNPDAIIINHINMKDEDPQMYKLNKRSRINYHYLKDISGYDLLYYNQLSGDYVRATNGILYKKGIDSTSMISRIKKKLSSTFWDNCILVKP